MASFSDDETFEVDQILEQRKRKGVLEYLVRWKTEGEDTWEPAKVLSVDCAKAVEVFKKTLKLKPSRSKSRSRSSSRSRKATTKTSKRSSRSSSRSRSRSRKEAVSVKKDTTNAKEEILVKEVVEVETKVSSRAERSARREKVMEDLTVNEKRVENTSSSEAASTESPKLVPSSSDSKAASQEENAGRVLRSSTMEARKKLEVQRVHNEQRPVRDDDSKPRSAIWKVADYSVIVLFVISVFAALILFLEKFVDLEDFKKQAFPNMGVLLQRLQYVQKSLLDLGQFGLDTVSDAWQYVVEQIKGTKDAAGSTVKH